ncbi:O-antigen polysaccharide polymerase Wzy [Novosphingobium sp.]|uniref:O-antigen polysaccharide polymerase Wzy n=1 Tax=Novosphingobium sp. TaxID=1874826 RepID=UPI0025CD17EA|nr:O-antigen polysaccharide polymerase Wzy [Novosphingobium sp.]
MYLVVLFASALLFGAITFAFVNSRYFSVFHPFTIYLLFHGLVFVVRPFLSYWLDYSEIYRAFRFTPSLSDKITVIIATNLGLLAFAFFCFRQGAVEMRFRKEPALDDERNRMARVFPLVLAICGPLAIWSLATHYSAAADFNTLSGMGRDKATGVIYNTRSSGYFTEAQMMLVPLTALSAWLFRFRLIALAPLAIFVAARAGTGGRGPFISALFATALLYLFQQRRRFPSLQVSALFAGAALLFATVGDDRGQAIRVFFGEESDYRKQGSDRLKFMEGMDFANLEFFEYIVYVVPQRSQTYGYFNDILQVFTEPVPRVLWPGKPFGAPFERFSLFDYGYPVGATRSLPGNGWYALGWLGVVITCAAWGYVLGLIYRRFALGPQRPIHVAGYMIFLATLIVAYRDGSPVTVFRQGIFFAAPVLLWYFLYARRNPKRKASPQRLAGRALAAPTAPGLPPAVARRRAMLGTIDHGARPK